MLTVKELMPKYAKEIRKRASTEYGIGHLTKAEFDEVIEHLDAIINIIDGIPNREVRPAAEPQPAQAIVAEVPAKGKANKKVKE